MLASTQRLWVGELLSSMCRANGSRSATAIDRETFDVMWDLSEPGKPTEHCFMRVSQTDYLLDGRDEGLDWMPDVCSAPFPFRSFTPS